jgi:hypothetical protein
MKKKKEKNIHTDREINIKTRQTGMEKKNKDMQR